MFRVLKIFQNKPGSRSPITSIDRCLLLNLVIGCYLTADGDGAMQSYANKTGEIKEKRGGGQRNRDVVSQNMNETANKHLINLMKI